VSNFRTLRGRIDFNPTDTPTGFAKRDLILDDGLINTGYVIEKFIVWPTDMNAFFQAPSGTNVYAQLATSITPIAQFDAGDNRQIAWSYADNIGNGIPATIIDEDHVINRDLYIRCFNTLFDQSKGVNYLIAMRKRKLSDDEAIITILKEDGQTSVGP